MFAAVASTVVSEELARVFERKGVQGFRRDAKIVPE
jgi:hypothetical protein